MDHKNQNNPSQQKGHQPNQQGGQHQTPGHQADKTNQQQGGRQAPGQQGGQTHSSQQRADRERDPADKTAKHDDMKR